MLVKRKYPVGIQGVGFLSSALIPVRMFAEKYRLEGRPITKVGIAFSSEERNITEWLSEILK